MPSSFLLPAAMLLILALWLTFWPLLLGWRRVKAFQLIPGKLYWFLLAGLLLWNLFTWAYLIRNSLLAHEALQQQLLPWKVLAAAMFLVVLPATFLFSFRSGWNRRIRAKAGIPIRQFLPKAGILLMGVELLLSLGILMKVAGSPLHFAARNGSTPLVQCALFFGADPNASDFYGITPLRQAVWNRKAAMAHILLQRGANPNARSETGWTPLMDACISGDLALIRLLLEAGADPTLGTSFASPLEILARAKAPEPACLEAASRLLRNGVPRHMIDMALITAASAGKEGMAGLLLQHGARVDAQDSSGQTPLQLAVLAQQARLVGQLLEAGANPERADHRGCTAMHKIAAAIPGQADLAPLRLLLEKKAVVDAADAEGWTALTHAVAARRNDLVELLLRAGAVVNRADQGGRTALMWAASAGAAETVTLLLQHGANPARRDAQQLSAREHALRNGFRELAASLDPAGKS